MKIPSTDAPRTCIINRLICSETEGQAKKSLPDRPNLILLHEGTNDLNRDPPLPDASEVGAPDRLGHLIDQIVTACPDATLLVAQLISSADPRSAARIKTYNAAIPDVVAQRTKLGHHVMVVDMSSIGDGYLIADGTHPTNFGYQKMANFWYQGIKNIPQGWLKAPIGTDPHPFIPDNAPEHTGCIAGRDTQGLEARQAKTGHYCLGLPIWTPLGRISHGVGFLVFPHRNDDPEKLPWLSLTKVREQVGTNGPAVFHQKWYNRGKIAYGFGLDGLNVLFADLRGTGKTDYLWINPKTSAMHAWLNDGDGTKFKWTEAKNPVATGQCPINRLRLPNLTGSGKADYVCIDKATGSVDAWFNKWSQSGGWTWDGPHRISGPVSGGNFDSIFYMDING